MLSPILLTGFTSGASLLVCIGSQNAFVLRQGLLRSHLFSVAFICICSDIILISSGIYGLGVIAQQWPLLMQLVRFGGAAFLAVNALQAARRAFYGSGVLNPQHAAMPSLQRVILTCLGYTWLNPHVYLDTIFMLGSLSLHYGAGDKWQFALGALSASFIWFSAITYGARILLPLFKNPNAWRRLDCGIAVLMGYFCLKLLLMPLH